MSAASREAWRDEQREMMQDPAYLDWLVVTTKREIKAKEEKQNEYHGQSERR